MEFLTYPVKYRKDEMLEWLWREEQEVLYRWLRKFLATGDGLPLNLHTDNDYELDSFLSLFAPQSSSGAKVLQRKALAAVNVQSTALLVDWDIIDGLEYLQNLLTVVGVLGARDAKPIVYDILTSDRLTRFREDPSFSSCYETAISVLFGMVDYNHLEQDVLDLCLRELYNPDVSLYCYRALCKSDSKYVLDHFIDMIQATQFLDCRLPAQALRAIVSICYTKETFSNFVEELVETIKNQDIVVMNRSFDVVVQAFDKDEIIVIEAAHPCELITYGNGDKVYRRPLLLNNVPYRSNYNNPKSAPVYTTISCIENWDMRWVASLCRATGLERPYITQEEKNTEYQQVALENSQALKSGVGLNG